MYPNLTRAWFKSREELFRKISDDKEFQRNLRLVVKILIAAAVNDKTIFIFGNGGSAAEAQHFAAELIGQFSSRPRRAIRAIALTTDTSIITAVSNDMGYAKVFSRQIEALCRPGDIAIGLTTSDVELGGEHSRNILMAFNEAKYRKAIRVGLFSQKTQHLLNYVDYAIIIPSSNTSLIQEAQLSVIHFLCAMIDEEFT